MVEDTNVDVHELADAVCNMLCECREKSVSRGQVSGNNDVPLSRWERLLNDEDDSCVWKVIYWSGEISNSACVNDQNPSDDDFNSF